MQCPKERSVAWSPCPTRGRSREGTAPSEPCAFLSGNDELRSFTSGVKIERVASVGSVKAVTFSECGKFLFAGVANVVRCFSWQEEARLLGECLFDAATHVLALRESRSLLVALGVGRAKVFAVKNSCPNSTQRGGEEIALLPVLSLSCRRWLLEARLAFLRFESQRTFSKESQRPSSRGFDGFPVCKSACLILGSSDGQVEFIRLADAQRLCVLRCEGTGLLYSMAVSVHPVGPPSSGALECTDGCPTCRQGLVSQARLLVAGGTVFTQVLLWGAALKRPFCNEGETSSSSPGKIRLLARLDGHRGVVFALRFFLQDQILLSASDDREVRLWRLMSVEKNLFDATDSLENGELSRGRESAEASGGKPLAEEEKAFDFEFLKEASRKAAVPLQEFSGRRLPWVGSQTFERGDSTRASQTVQTKCFAVLRGHRSRIWQADFLDLREALPAQVREQLQRRLLEATSLTDCGGEEFASTSVVEKENRATDPPPGSASGSKLLSLAASFLFVLTGGEDARLCVWNLRGACLAALPAHEGRGIRSLASASGKAAAASAALVFASGGEDGALKLWSASALPCLWKALASSVQTALSKLAIRVGKSGNAQDAAFDPRALGVYAERNGSSLNSSASAGADGGESSAGSFSGEFSLNFRSPAGRGVAAAECHLSRKDSSESCQGGSLRDFVRCVFFLRGGKRLLVCSNFGHVYSAPVSQRPTVGEGGGPLKEIIFCTSAVVTCANLVDDCLALGTADGEVKLYRHPSLAGEGATSAAHECLGDFSTSPQCGWTPAFAASRVSFVFAFSLGPLSGEVQGVCRSAQASRSAYFFRLLSEEGLFPLARSSTSVVSAWREVSATVEEVEGPPSEVKAKTSTPTDGALLAAGCDHRGNVVLLLARDAPDSRAASASSVPSGASKRLLVQELGRVCLPRASARRPEEKNERSTNRFFCALAFARIFSSALSPGGRRRRNLALLAVMGDEHGSLHVLRVSVPEGTRHRDAPSFWQWGEALVSAQTAVPDAHPRRKVCCLAVCGSFLFSCGGDGRLLVMRVFLEETQGETAEAVRVEWLQTLRLGLVSAFVSLEPSSETLFRLWWIRGRSDLEALRRMRETSKQNEKVDEETELETASASAFACGFRLAKQHLAVGVKGNLLQVLDLQQSALLLSVECGDAKRSFSVCADTAGVEALAFSRGAEVCVFLQKGALSPSADAGGSALARADFISSRSPSAEVRAAGASEGTLLAGACPRQSQSRLLLPALHGSDVHDALFLGPFELCTCGEDNSVKVLRLDAQKQSQPPHRFPLGLQREPSRATLLRGLALASSTSRHHAPVLSLCELALWSTKRKGSLRQAHCALETNASPPRLVVSAGAAKTLSLFAVVAESAEAGKTGTRKKAEADAADSFSRGTKFELLFLDRLCLEDRNAQERSSNARFSAVTGCLVARSLERSAVKESAFDICVLALVSTAHVLLVAGSLVAVDGRVVSVTRRLAFREELSLSSTPLSCVFFQQDSSPPEDPPKRVAAEAVVNCGARGEDEELVPGGFLFVGLSDGNIACASLDPPSTCAVSVGPSLRPVGILRAHQRAVTSVCVGKLEQRVSESKPDFERQHAAMPFLLCSSGDDGALSLQVITLEEREGRGWKVEVLSRVCIPSAHEAAARCLCLRPPFLVSVGWDRWINVWRVAADVPGKTGRALGDKAFAGGDGDAEFPAEERVRLLRNAESCSLCGAGERGAKGHSLCRCRPPLSCFNSIGEVTGDLEGQEANARRLDSRLEGLLLSRCGGLLSDLIVARRHFFSLSPRRHGETNPLHKEAESQTKAMRFEKSELKALFFCLERRAAAKTSVFEASAIACYPTTTMCTAEWPQATFTRICCVGAGGGIDVFDVHGVEPREIAPVSNGWNLRAL